MFVSRVSQGAKRDTYLVRCPSDGSPRTRSVRFYAIYPGQRLCKR